MDLTLYNLLIQQLPEPPDLSIILDRHPMPEEWPVVLEKLETFRKQTRSFQVTDGKRSITCISTLPEVYERVSALELGTIVHLIGCETVFDDDRRTYVLDVQSVCTLKEYDDYLKEQHQREMERLAYLREQDYLEQMQRGGDVHSAPSNWNGI
jgi:hypothetical protein